MQVCCQVDMWRNRTKKRLSRWQNEERNIRWLQSPKPKPKPKGKQRGQRRRRHKRHYYSQAANSWANIPLRISTNAYTTPKAERTIQILCDNSPLERVLYGASGVEAGRRGPRLASSWHLSAHIVPYPCRTASNQDPGSWSWMAL